MLQLFSGSSALKGHYCKNFCHWEKGAWEMNASKAISPSCDFSVKMLWVPKAWCPYQIQFQSRKFSDKVTYSNNHLKPDFKRSIRDFNHIISHCWRRNYSGSTRSKETPILTWCLQKRDKNLKSYVDWNCVERNDILKTNQDHWFSRNSCGGGFKLQDATECKQTAEYQTLTLLFSQHLCSWDLWL